MTLPKKMTESLWSVGGDLECADDVEEEIPFRHPGVRSCQLEFRFEQRGCLMQNVIKRGGREGVKRSKPTLAILIRPTLANPDFGFGQTDFGQTDFGQTDFGQTNFGQS